MGNVSSNTAGHLDTHPRESISVINDARCKSCEWWDAPGDMQDLIEDRRCLRWPGDPWLRTFGDDRCWQWTRRLVGEGDRKGPDGR